MQRRKLSFLMFALIVAVMAPACCKKKILIVEKEVPVEVVKVVEKEVTPPVAEPLPENPLTDEEKLRRYIENFAPVQFAFDRAKIREPERIRLMVLRITLRSSQKVGKVVLTGNCDERGSDTYNYRLGMRRAQAVRDMLKAKLPDVAFEIRSNGESNPVCDEHNEGCWQKNRRVEIALE